MLDLAEVPAHRCTSMFTCARTAGRSAHILERERERERERKRTAGAPSARYVGPGSRDPREIEGHGEMAGHGEIA